MHCKSYSHFFSKKFQHICVSIRVNFNESLTNDAVSFEQLGPDVFRLLFKYQGSLLFKSSCFTACTANYLFFIQQDVSHKLLIKLFKIVKIEKKKLFQIVLYCKVAISLQSDRFSQTLFASFRATMMEGSGTLEDQLDATKVSQICSEIIIHYILFFYLFNLYHSLG